MARHKIDQDDFAAQGLDDLVPDDQPARRQANFACRDGHFDDGTPDLVLASLTRTYSDRQLLKCSPQCKDTNLASPMISTENVVVNLPMDLSSRRSILPEWSPTYSKPF